MFLRIFKIRIYEFCHQYFSVKKTKNRFLLVKNKYCNIHIIIKQFLVKQIIHNIREEKFVKICRELDLGQGFVLGANDPAYVWYDHETPHWKF